MAWYRRIGMVVCAALLCLQAGCLEEQVSTATTGKEFAGEETLNSIRKGIIGWQSMHMDDPLPDSLTEIANVPAEVRTAPGGQVDNYVILFLKAGDNTHYVLVAYPGTYGFNGQRTFFLSDMGSIQSRDFGKDYDHSDWDYDSALREAGQ